MHRLLRKGLSRQWRAAYPGFDIVRDPAWLAVDGPDGSPVRGLDVVIRHNPFSPADDVSCVAALVAPRPDTATGDSADGTEAHASDPPSRLSEIITRLAVVTGSPLPAVSTEWFLRYLEQVVRPVLWLDGEAGIALEAHQQNTLLLLDADGWPAGGRYRDNQGYYFRESRRAELDGRLPGIGERSDTFVSDEVTDERFAYYLAINNVFGLVGAFGSQRLADERLLLAAFRRFLGEAAAGPRRLRGTLPARLLDSPVLRCKANLLTRIHGLDELVGPVDTQSVYVTISNPLHPATAEPPEDPYRLHLPTARWRATHCASACRPRLARRSAPTAASAMTRVLVPTRTQGGTDGEDKSVQDEDAVRKQALASVENVHDVAERIVNGSEWDVVWYERHDRFGASLRVAPMSVSGLLREKLFSDRSVILTSATLKLGGDFNGVGASLGLAPEGTQGDDVPQWKGIDVGSPFDYRRQGILYVAKHLARPARDGDRADMLDELTELIQAAGGRTLGLFSSMRAAQMAAEDLRSRIPEFPILLQGEETLGELIKNFAADPKTCLCGTLSLWQGVDVRARAASSSSWTRSRSRAPTPLDERPAEGGGGGRGGNGFMAVAATHAALLTAQGAGRLVRASGDRGVVAVLDPRLATARYGSYLKASLPDFWYTTDRNQVRKSLAATTRRPGRRRRGGHRWLV
ncbi:3'-5' exonuclease DinG [Streptomyces fumanus]